MKTEFLISALAQDNAPGRSFRQTIAIAFLAGCCVAAAVFVIGMGPRPDFSEAMHTVRFPFKFVVTILLAATASAFVIRYSRPGAKLGWIGRALVIPPLLLASAAIAELILVPKSLWMTRLIGSNSRFCLTLIPLLSIGPLACLLMALRKGHLQTQELPAQSQGLRPAESRPRFMQRIVLTTARSLSLFGILLRSVSLSLSDTWRVENISAGNNFFRSNQNHEQAHPSPG